MGAEGAQASLAIGERIKQRRAAAGLSQEALAQLVGVSRQTVSNWERSRTTPDAYALKRIAEACGTTVDSLLGGDAAAVHDRALATRRELVCAAAILLGTQLVSIAINAATAVFADGAASEDFARPFAAFRLGGLRDRHRLASHHRAQGRPCQHPPDDCLRKPCVGSPRQPSRPRPEVRLPLVLDAMARSRLRHLRGRPAFRRRRKQQCPAFARRRGHAWTRGDRLFLGAWQKQQQRPSCERGMTRAQAPCRRLPGASPSSIGGTKRPRPHATH